MHRAIWKHSAGSMRESRTIPIEHRRKSADFLLLDNFQQVFTFGGCPDKGHQQNASKNKYCRKTEKCQAMDRRKMNFLSESRQNSGKFTDTKELIEAIGTGNVGFVLDSWHWRQAGDIAEQILTLQGDEIIAVDLNDAPRDVKKRAQLDHQRELPASTEAMGAIDVKAFLNAIHQTGFDGLCSR